MRTLLLLALPVPLWARGQKILIIGDSISFSYTPFGAKALAGKVAIGSHGQLFTTTWQPATNSSQRPNGDFSAAGGGTFTRSGLVAAPSFSHGANTLAGRVSAPDDGFFDQTATFIGGIGDEDWTEEWTSFIVATEL